MEFLYRGRGRNRDRFTTLKEPPILQRLGGFSHLRHNSSMYGRTLLTLLSVPLFFLRRNQRSHIQEEVNQIEQIEELEMIYPLNDQSHLRFTGQAFKAAEPQTEVMKALDKAKRREKREKKKELTSSEQSELQRKKERVKAKRVKHKKRKAKRGYLTRVERVPVTDTYKRVAEAIIIGVTLLAVAYRGPTLVSLLSAVAVFLSFIQSMKTENYRDALGVQDLSYSFTVISKELLWVVVFKSGVYPAIIGATLAIIYPLYRNSVRTSRQ